eukprot:793342-Rhodomonas_salina.1
MRWCGGKNTDEQCSRQGGVNKDVPCFLVYPDGSHSLGMISPAAGQAADDPGAVLPATACLCKHHGTSTC